MLERLIDPDDDREVIDEAVDTSGALKFALAVTKSDGGVEDHFSGIASSPTS